MGMFDNLLSEMTEHADVANLAQKVGLDPSMVEGAVAALAHSHTQAGDTAEGAAAATGLPLDKIQEIITHIGGEGLLGRYAQMVTDNPDVMKTISGIAGSFFGNKG